MLLNTTRSLKLAKVANAMFSHSYVFFPTNWQLTRRYYRLETNILKLLIHIDSNVWREIETTFCIFLEALYSNNVSLDSGQIRSSSSYRLTVWSRTAAWFQGNDVSTRQCYQLRITTHTPRGGELSLQIVSSQVMNLSATLLPAGPLSVIFVCLWLNNNRWDDAGVNRLA